MVNKYNSVPYVSAVDIFHKIKHTFAKTIKFNKLIENICLLVRIVGQVTLVIGGGILECYLDD